MKSKSVILFCLLFMVIVSTTCYAGKPLGELTSQEFIDKYFKNRELAPLEGIWKTGTGGGFGMRDWQFAIVKTDAVLAELKEPYQEKYKDHHYIVIVTSSHTRGDLVTGLNTTEYPNLLTHQKEFKIDGASFGVINSTTIVWFQTGGTWFRIYPKITGLAM